MMRDARGPRWGTERSTSQDRVREHARAWAMVCESDLVRRRAWSGPSEPCEPEPVSRP